MPTATLPKPNTTVPQVFKAHPMGFLTSEVTPAFDGRIDDVNDKLSQLIAIQSAKLARVEEDFRPSAQVAARDKIQEHTYPQFTHLIQDEVRFIKQATREQTTRAESALQLTKADNNDMPSRIFKNNIIRDLLNQIAADLKPEAAFNARNALLAAAAASGDRSVLRFHDALPRVAQLAMFRDADVENARKLYSESQDPEAFRDLRHAAEYLPQIRFNLKLAAKKMQLTHRWHADPEGESAFNTAIHDVKQHIGALPDGFEDLESVLIRHKLRPLGTIDLT